MRTAVSATHDTLRHEDKLCVLLLNCGPYKLYRLLEDPATDRLTHPTAMKPQTNSNHLSLGLVLEKTRGLRDHIWDHHTCQAEFYEDTIRRVKHRHLTWMRVKITGSMHLQGVFRGRQAGITTTISLLRRRESKRRSAGWHNDQLLRKSFIKAY